MKRLKGGLQFQHRDDCDRDHGHRPRCECWGSGNIIQPANTTGNRQYRRQTARFVKADRTKKRLSDREWQKREDKRVANDLQQAG